MPIDLGSAVAGDRGRSQNREPGGRTQGYRSLGRRRLLAREDSSYRSAEDQYPSIKSFVPTCTFVCHYISSVVDSFCSLTRHLKGRSCRLPTDVLVGNRPLTNHRLSETVFDAVPGGLGGILDLVKLLVQ